METNLLEEVLKVKGMVCTSCESKIEETLQEVNGIYYVKALMKDANVKVKFDSMIVSLSEIENTIESMDYELVKDGETSSQNNDTSSKQLIGIGVIILAVYLIIKNTIGFNFIPEISTDMGYGILFVVGLLTSLHCIAMCGGINLSQCATYSNKGTSKLSNMKPSLLYNLGRVISYTLIGGIVGAIGSVVSLSGGAKGMVSVIAGVFMIIMGLNMLNVFPWLKKINPRMPKIFRKKIGDTSQNGPLFVGLLNGLMPCGPLQSMQLYALGTGSFIAGAMSMFMFSIGTVPLMFGFGAVSTLLSGKFTKKMMKVSALLVMILGIVMFNRGLNLSGVNIGFPVLAKNLSQSNIAKIDGGFQYVTTSLESGNYTPIVVQKGIPVKWNITVKEGDLNGCNNPITIPEYNKQVKLIPGDNLIEFTPSEEGKVTYTCWMGMISSTINVVSDTTKISENQIQELSTSNSDYTNSSGSCCSASAEATRFVDGKVPTDDVFVAEIKNGKQEVTITVNNKGFSPAAIVLQKGIPVKIKFDDEEINYCNNVIVFPEYKGQLNLEKGETETPYFEPTEDFTFSCWMGMLNGYFKVVDDLENINLDKIIDEISNYKSSSGGGCH